MNKHIIFSILLALVAVSGWAQKVWTNPGYRNEPHGFQFDVNEVRKFGPIRATATNRTDSSLM